MKNVVDLEGLKALAGKSILDDSQLAKLFGIHIRTLKRRVKQGDFPKPFKLGAKSYWRPNDILEHIDKLANHAQSSSERISDTISSFLPKE